MYIFRNIHIYFSSTWQSRLVRILVLDRRGPGPQWPAVPAVAPVARSGRWWPRDSSACYQPQGMNNPFRLDKDRSDRRSFGLGFNTVPWRPWRHWRLWRLTCFNGAAMRQKSIPENMQESRSRDVVQIGFPQGKPWVSLQLYLVLGGCWRTFVHWRWYPKWVGWTGKLTHLFQA